MSPASPSAAASSALQLLHWAAAAFGCHLCTHSRAAPQAAPKGFWIREYPELGSSRPTPHRSSQKSGHGMTRCHGGFPHAAPFLLHSAAAMPARKGTTSVCPRENLFSPKAPMEKKKKEEVNKCHRAFQKRSNCLCGLIAPVLQPRFLS